MNYLTLGLTVLLTAGGLQQSSAAPVGDVVEEVFKDPPPAARPGVFWNWMGGLLDREAMTKDLESLAEQGFGRVLVMMLPEQNAYPWQWPFRDYPGKVKMFSDEWFDLANHAIGECDRLGLEFAIMICPGYGHVGGPDVPKEKGVKVIAVTEVGVTGPGDIDQTLPTPPAHPVDSPGSQIPPWSSNFAEAPKPAMNFFRDEAVLAVPDLGAGTAVTPEAILDISDKLDADGRLRWHAPEGKWRIQRYCLISENGINHPAPPEGNGLEADRMDPEAVRIVYKGMVDRMRREALAKGYKSLTAFETDSYETGFQDFGLDYREEFKKRRGYDPVPWLPSWGAWQQKAPVVIGSPDQTARFSQDMLRTLSEVWAERFHGTLRKLAMENGMDFMTEPYFKLPLDWTMLGGRATIPGEEFWVGPNGTSQQRIGNASEIAALYGQKFIWAESFTALSYLSSWRNDPWTFKRGGDEAFTRGVNRLIMHGYTHTPFPDEYQPGLTFGFWGSQLTRHLTWWKMARPWADYLSRCQALLQEGRPSFDVLRYPMPYDPNLVTHQDEPYRVARLTDEVLMRDLTVRDGKLVLPHGQEFSVLHLIGPPIRPEALARIKQLVEAGATVIGNPPPTRSPSLENYPNCDAEVARLIGEIWGPYAVGSESGVHTLGKGRIVVRPHSLEQGMQILGMAPDFIWLTGGLRIRSHLRLTGEATYWFISNQEDSPVQGEASFGVTGLQPEWWDPTDGSMRDLPEFRFENGRTIVPLTFAARGSGFVVFRHAVTEADASPKRVNFAKTFPHSTVPGPWQVQFDPTWGGPKDPVTFEALTDWSQHSDPAIHYFSGTAFYRTTFDAPEDLEADAEDFRLDIGQVYNLARVRLNGRDLGVIWCAPWQVKIPAGLLKAKGNQLEIEVVNTWANRLIGDEQWPEDFETVPAAQGNHAIEGGYARGVFGRALKDLPDWFVNRTPRPSKNRYTFVSWFNYNKDAPLQPSGLLGPVRIFSNTRPPSTVKPLTVGTQIGIDCGPVSAPNWNAFTAATTMEPGEVVGLDGNIVDGVGITLTAAGFSLDGQTRWKAAPDGGLGELPPAVTSDFAFGSPEIRVTITGLKPELSYEASMTTAATIAQDRIDTVTVAGAGKPQESSIPRSDSARGVGVYHHFKGIRPTQQGTITITVTDTSGNQNPILNLIRLEAFTPTEESSAVE